MHANAMSKGLFIQVIQLKCLCQIKSRGGVDGYFGHLEVLRVAHILEQIIHVAFRRGPELAHGAKECDECASQTFADDWPP